LSTWTTDSISRSTAVLGVVIARGGEAGAGVYASCGVGVGGAFAWPFVAAGVSRLSIGVMSMSRWPGCTSG